MEVLSFRVDANAAMGIGHAMRCLALAQAWTDKGNRAMFLMAETLPQLDTRLRREGIDLIRIEGKSGTLEDARETAAASRGAGAEWIVLDGYHFDSTYQGALKAAGLPLLVIDDHGHAGRYPADIVVNQNPDARSSWYRDRAPTTRLLFGPRYALLRREFRRLRAVRRSPSSEVGEVLVTVGGVNRNDVIALILRGLAKVDRAKFRVTAVLGAAADDEASLNSLANELKLQVRLTGNVPDMAKVMARSDLAIAGAGTTAWELARMGVPSLLTVLADNQRAVAESLDRRGIAWNLGHGTELTSGRVAMAVNALCEDPVRRAAMAEGGRALVDGDGVDRVLREMSLPRLVLRPVLEEDMRQIWAWSNEPGARAASFATDPIPWDDHVKWFRQKLADPRCRFYLASEAAGRPVGQIRFDIDGSDAEVSVSLDTEFRGRGYGASLIRVASQKLFDESDVETIQAYLKEANEASARAFLDAGYEDLGPKAVRGQPARHFARIREVDR